MRIKYPLLSALFCFGCQTKNTAQQPKKFNPYLAASTGVGQTRKVILDDSSTVILNAYSSLMYNKKFKREIQISGQASFDIHQDTSKTFKVRVDSVVLETDNGRFDVEAYEADEGKNDSPTIVLTVLSGSVKIRTLRDSSIYHKGESASFNRVSCNIRVPNNYDDLVHWMDGYYKFCFIRLPKFFALIQRHYDVVMICKNRDAKFNILSYLDVNLKEPLTTLMARIERTHNYHFDRLSGDTIELVFGTRAK